MRKDADTDAEVAYSQALTDFVNGPRDRQLGASEPKLRGRASTTMTVMSEGYGTSQAIPAGHRRIPGLIERPRLHQVLDALHAGGTVGVMSAPAGFAKTCLAESRNRHGRSANRVADDWASRDEPAVRQ